MYLLHSHFSTRQGPSMRKWMSGITFVKTTSRDTLPDGDDAHDIHVRNFLPTHLALPGRHYRSPNHGISLLTSPLIQLHVIRARSERASQPMPNFRIIARKETGNQVSRGACVLEIFDTAHAQAASPIVTQPNNPSQGELVTTNHKLVQQRQINNPP